MYALWLLADIWLVISGFIGVASFLFWAIFIIIYDKKRKK